MRRRPRRPHGRSPGPTPGAAGLAGELVETTLRSEALGRDLPLVVHRPDVPPDPLPVLLHGCGQPATGLGGNVCAVDGFERLHPGPIEPEFAMRVGARDEPSRASRHVEGAR